MIVVGMENAESNIHNTAIVHPNAKLGKDVVIGPGAVIGENVEIGDGTQIGANVVIGGWTTIGKRCEIYPGASIGLEPQDLKFKGEKSYCYVGDETVIREFVTISRATGEGEETRVGNNCLLQACTHVAHNCIVGNNVIMSNCAGLAGHAIVEDRVVIGGLAGVHQFVKIGQPARVIGLNSVGLSRAGISEEVRRSLKQAFRIIYRSGFSLSRAIEEMEMQLDSSVEIENLLRFLRNADRGIMRTRRD